MEQNTPYSSLLERVAKLINRHFIIEDGKIKQKSSGDQVSGYVVINFCKKTYGIEDYLEHIAVTTYIKTWVKINSAIFEYENPNVKSKRIG